MASCLSVRHIHRHSSITELTAAIDFSKEFTASVGPGVTADQSRKNCQINLDISYSPGYTYSVYSADYTGYANIESGVKGIVAARYYFSGEQETVRCSPYISPTSLPAPGLFPPRHRGSLIREYE